MNITKETPLNNERYFFFVFSDFFFEFLDTLGTYILTLVINDALSAITENASRMILMQNDVITVYKNLKCVFLCDVESTAQFDRKDYSSQLIHFSHNTC